MIGIMTNPTKACEASEERMQALSERAHRARGRKRSGRRVHLAQSDLFARSLDGTCEQLRQECDGTSSNDEPEDAWMGVTNQTGQVVRGGVRILHLPID